MKEIAEYWKYSQQIINMQNGIETCHSTGKPLV